MAQVTRDGVIVPIGLRAAAGFVPEAVRALRGHLRLKPGSLSRDEVQSYFRERTAAGDITMEDVVASGSVAYQRLLSAMLSEMRRVLRPSPTRARLLDFGCGNGALLETLDEMGFDGPYLGYDFNKPMIDELRKSSVLNRRFESRLPDEEFDVVFLINVLAYTSDAELHTVLSELASHLTYDGFVLVAEPMPAWYWETRFDGLRLRLRKQDEVDFALSSLGFDLHQASVVSVGALAGQPLLPLAWSGIWRRTNVG